MATNFDLEHDRCRSEVCVVCYEKASRTLSDLEINTVQTFLIDGYSVYDPDFPNGVCTGCSINLSKKRKDVEFKIKVVENYNPDRRTGLRSIDTCECRICKVAKLNGPMALLKKHKKNKRGRPTSNPTPNYLKICSNCLSTIAKGSNHSASVCKHSKRSKVDKLIQISSPSSLQRAASRDQKNLQVTSLLGRTKKVEEVKKTLFSSADCSGIQQDLGISNSQTKTLLRDIRLATGSRNIIEKDAFIKIQEKNRQLDPFFKIEKLMYQIEEKDTKTLKHLEVPTIICRDLPRLVDIILEKRQRKRDQVMIKISIDGGGGFLKICLSIFDKDDPTSISDGALSKKFMESGVKKIIIIGIVPDIPENYVNVKRLWLNCGAEKLNHYTIATDLKLCNILLGMMSHSSCHPCPWCDIKKEVIHKKGTQRTILSLMNLFWDFFESRDRKSDAKKYGNVIHPPIICDDIDNETPVILLIPPPELHLLIGPVNKIYSALESKWSGSINWLKCCNVKKEEYHGGSFAGNESRKLLKNIDRLETLSPPPTCNVFINALRSFNAVVSSCYGSNLKPSYKEDIKRFRIDYSKLGISVTPKVHAVMYHIEEFCEITGRGLGPWSEQSGESVHHDFKKTWSRFLVNGTDREIYGENLLKAVSTYNSQHL